MHCLSICGSTTLNISCESEINSIQNEVGDRKKNGDGDGKSYEGGLFFLSCFPWRSFRSFYLLPSLQHVFLKDDIMSSPEAVRGPFSISCPWECCALFFGWE